MIETPSLRVLDMPPAHPQKTFRGAVVEGLSQIPPTLPCRFFYDDRGSALFERICRLPEYYLTRTERAILERHAGEMIGASVACGAAGSRLALIELGSGSAGKTRLLIEAALARQPALHYVPIDISRDFLRAAGEDLLREYRGLSVTAIAAEYDDALDVLPPHDGPRLLLFLGSNIGNFDGEQAAAFLRRIREQMEDRDRLLIGVDLVKDRAVLEAAYNDAAGVTAAFNKNLLVRINGELGGNFDLDAWEHRAPFVAERSRIEMWLVSRRAQTVTLAGMNSRFAFGEGEGIHTESSHKHTPEGFTALCRAAGLEIDERWTDARDWFAVFLLRPGEKR
jgi:L-histidine N-alpha-methyltransferase